MIIFVDSRVNAHPASTNGGNRRKRRKQRRPKLPIMDTPTNGQSCLPFAIKCRVTKTFFGVPRKCDQCHKMIVLTAGYSCQFCRYRCHKKCRTFRPKLCSMSQIPSGDPAIMKAILTENEINCNEHYEFPEGPWTVACDGTTPLDIEVQPLNYSGVYDVEPMTSCSSGGPRRSDSIDSLETLTSAEPTSPLVLEPPSTPPNRGDQSPICRTLKREDALVESDSMIDRFFRLFPWNKPPQEDSLGAHSSSAMSSIGPLRLHSGASSGVFPSSPTRTPVDEFNHAVLEDLFAQRSISSTSAVSSVNTNSSLNRRWNWAQFFAGHRAAQSTECALDRDPAADRKARKISEFFNRNSFEEECIYEEEHSTVKLSSTWPLSGLHINHDDSDFCDSANDGSYLSDILRQPLENKQDSQEDTNEGSIRNSLDCGEWSIPHVDLQYDEWVYEGANVTTHRGRWHGEVMIHQYKNKDVQTFLQEVHSLTKIRHENVALFMGACTEPEHLSIVTSIRKGDSLYEAVHINKRRMSHHSKVNVARQIAQGMGYLHAKGIVLKCLSSNNIYLDSKVKICLVDYGGPLIPREEKAVVRKGHLTYLSPELMSALRVSPPSLITDPTLYSKHSDVYAFGTVLYEMFAGAFPLSTLEAEAIIWWIGNGQRQCVDHLNCHVVMKSLIEDCWSQDTTYRPSSQQILRELHQTAALHKKHSSSEPEVNKTGLWSTKGIPYQSIQPASFQPYA